jgi:hypothetical protein
MTLERLSMMWARVSHVSLRHGVVALATVCAGAFALGIAAGMPLVVRAPLSGATNGSQSGVATPNTNTNPTPAPVSPSQPAISPPSAPQPAPATGSSPSIAPPADAPPGFYTAPQWPDNGDNGDGWDGPSQDDQSNPWAGPPGYYGGGYGHHGWHGGRHGHRGGDGGGG